MNKWNQLLALVVGTVVLGLSSGRLAAQTPPPGPSQGGPPPGGGNFDPQQFQQQIQQRLVDSFREQLAVTNDDEWSVIESRLTKVVQVRMQTLMGGMGGFRGIMGGNRGNGGQAGGRRGFAGFGQPDPDAEALRKAVESNASMDQIKAAMARYREARKQKEAELARAQDQLRQVLSLRQEAMLVSMGMLD